MMRGGLDTGWTFYTPYSSMYSNTNVSLSIVGAFILGFSSIFTGLNFIVTIHKMRAPGLTWFRLPLFIWAQYATSVIIVLGTPVVAITLMLVLVERAFGVGIFSPEIGGDPVLFQHLFWFYSHPAVYIMILPSMGVVSELMAAFCRKRVFGYSFVAFSSIAIAVLGFLVWGHHMFVTSQSMYSSMVFSIISFLVAVPSAIKVFNWTFTIYKGSVQLSAPMIYALGFLGLFTIGGLTGLFLAALATDIHLTDTYFVIAHFHYVMVGGSLLGFLGGIHFWWPKMTGKLYSELWAKIAAALTFIGFNLTFFPQFMVGYLGMPRRYHFYPAEFQPYHIMSSAGASVLALALFLPAIYLTYSIIKGPPAGNNPWGAIGLEWMTTSPPPTLNFEETPIVTWEAYEYSPEVPAEAQRDRELMPGAEDGAQEQLDRDPRTLPGHTPDRSAGE
jgi:cytochrome c oxidase subunit I